MDFEKLAAPLVQVYEEVTDQILENIARHFSTGKGLPTIDWQMRKLAEMGQLRQENIRIIARKTGQNPELIRIALESAANQALKKAEPELKEAVRRGYLHDGGPLEASKGVERVFTSYQRQAEDTANLVNTVMLDSGMQSYRRVVSDVVQYEQAAMSVTQADAAQNILNTETGKVLTGVSSRQEALRRAIKRMADNGLTGFVDRGGHNWQPETYINMDIRSTCGNVATEAVFARNEDYGNDLFWVTVKATARPLCYPWQGKVISRNDRSGYAEDLDGNRVEIIPISSTSYGEPAGLYGINCGHVPPNVFIPGLGKVRGEVPDEAENNARYAESQEQRGLERRIRYAKREAATLEAAGLDAADAKEKVKAAQADMRAFINRTGRTRRSDREQIGTAISSAPKAAPKAPIKPAFTPADSIEEAQQYADRFVESYKGKYTGKVDYKGVDLTYANEMNRALTEVLDQYEVDYKIRNITPFNRREKRFKDTTAEAAYQWGTGDLFFNKDYLKSKKAMDSHVKEYRSLLDTVLPNIDTAIEKARQKTGFGADVQLRYVKALKETGRTNVNEPDAYGSMIHELGHYLDDRIFTKARKEIGFDLSASFEKYSGKISAYATSNKQEYVAESFAAWWKGESDVLDPELVKIFEGSKKK